MGLLVVHRCSWRVGVLIGVVWRVAYLMLPTVALRSLEAEFGTTMLPLESARQDSKSCNLLIHSLRRTLLDVRWWRNRVGPTQKHSTTYLRLQLVRMKLRKIEKFAQPLSAAFIAIDPSV
jgi:hypothetical protein